MSISRIPWVAAWAFSPAMEPLLSAKTTTSCGRDCLACLAILILLLFRLIPLSLPSIDLRPQRRLPVEGPIVTPACILVPCPIEILSGLGLIALRLVRRSTVKVSLGQPAVRGGWPR